jgi:mannose-1-phosphate guanylyltransferase
MRGLILCAGLGERLRPITSTIAKPTVPFLNIPMLGFPLFWFEQMGLDRLVINTHYQKESVEKAARSLVEWDYALDFRHESPEILGSGGAMWNARDELSGSKNFITANGDAVFLLDRKSALNEMLAFHEHSKSLATLLTCPYPGVGETIPGVWVDANENVIAFGKSAPQPGAKCSHYTGVAIFSDRILDVLPAGPSNILYDILVKEIARGERVSVWTEEMKWFETGKPQEYLSASQECLEMLFTGGGVRWHLVDILDRFAPGWRNYTERNVFAHEKPLFAFSATDRVLLGANVKSATPVSFQGKSIIGNGADLSNTSNIEGIYMPAIDYWVK